MKKSPWTRVGGEVRVAAPKARSTDSRAGQFGPEYTWNPPREEVDPDTNRADPVAASGWYERTDDAFRQYQEEFKTNKTRFADDPGLYWQVIWAPQHGVRKHRYPESVLKSQMQQDPASGVWVHKPGVKNWPYVAPGDAKLSPGEIRKFITDYVHLYYEVNPGEPPYAHIFSWGVWTASHIKGGYPNLFINMGDRIRDEAKKYAAEVLPQAIDESATSVFGGDRWKAWWGIYMHGTPIVPGVPDPNDGVTGLTTREAGETVTEYRDGQAQEFRVTQPGLSVGREILRSRPDVFEQVQSQLAAEPDDQVFLGTVQRIWDDQQLRDHIVPAVKARYSEACVKLAQEFAPENWVGRAIEMLHEEESLGRGPLLGGLKEAISEAVAEGGLNPDIPLVQALSQRHYDMQRLKIDPDVVTDNERHIYTLVEHLYRLNAPDRLDADTSNTRLVEYTSDPEGSAHVMYAPSRVQEKYVVWDLFAEGLNEYLKRIHPPMRFHDFLWLPVAEGGEAALAWIANRYAQYQVPISVWAAMMNEVYAYELVPRRVNTPGGEVSGMRQAFRLRKVAVPIGDDYAIPEEERRKRTPKRFGQNMAIVDHAAVQRHQRVSPASFPVDTSGPYVGKHGPKNPIWKYVRRNMSTAKPNEGVDMTYPLGYAFLESELNPATGKPFVPGDEIGIYENPHTGEREYPLLAWMQRHGLSAYIYPDVESHLTDETLGEGDDAEPNMHWAGMQSAFRKKGTVNRQQQTSQYYNRSGPQQMGNTQEDPIPALLKDYEDVILDYVETMQAQANNYRGPMPNVWSNETIRDSAPSLQGRIEGWLEYATQRGMQRWQIEWTAGEGLVNDPMNPPRWLAIDPAAPPTNLHQIREMFGDAYTPPPEPVKTVHRLLSYASQACFTRNLHLFESLVDVADWLHSGLPDIYDNWNETYKFIRQIMGRDPIQKPPSETFLPNVLEEGTTPGTVEIDELPMASPAPLPAEQAPVASEPEPELPGALDIDDLPFERHAFRLSKGGAR